MSVMRFIRGSGLSEEDLSLLIIESDAINPAAQAGKADVVRFLIERIARGSESTRDRFREQNHPLTMGGSTAIDLALHLALSRPNNVDVFHVLIANGARISVSRLEYAVRQAATDPGHTSNLEFLLRHAPYPLPVSGFKAWDGHHEYACIFLGLESPQVTKTIATMRPETLNFVMGLPHDGYTPLFEAVREGYAETVRVIVDASPREFDVRSARHVPSGDTLLHVGVRHPVVLKMLLVDYELDPNTRNTEDEPPLFRAIKHKQTESVKLLIDHGADVPREDDAWYVKLGERGPGMMPVMKEAAAIKRRRQIDKIIQETITHDAFGERGLRDLITRYAE